MEGVKEGQTVSTLESLDNAFYDIAFNEIMASETVAPTIKFEQKKRRFNDTATWLAEVLDGAMVTPVEYKLQDDILYTEDGEQAEKMFDNSVQAAKKLPLHLAFEYRRSLIEKSEFDDMLKLAKGELVHPQTGEIVNTIVVESDFPPELMSITKDVGGYNARRKSTMQRVITKTPSGVKIITTTLDGSDRSALEDIYSACGYIPESGELLGQRMYLSLNEQEQYELPTKLRSIYDDSLKRRYGGQWYAGRYGGSGQNTYDFVLSQQDLIHYYLNTTNSFSGGDKEYALAAAMTKRFRDQEKNKASNNESICPTGVSIVKTAALQSEINEAAALALLSGESFSGCGATLNGEGSESGDGDYFAMGYGNLSIQDKYGPLEFNCQNGHVNTRDYGKLIKSCKKCGINVSCA